MPGENRLAFLGGKAFTADAKNSIVSDVYVEGGRIRRVGDAEEIRKSLPPDTRIVELASGIAAVAEGTPEGEWIRGWGMDYAKYPEGRMPTRWDIDDMTRRHPVIIVHTSGHFALVNSVALEQAGITDDVQDPKGGRFVRDEKGRITGMLLDSAQRVVIKGAVDVGNHGPGLERDAEAALVEGLSLRREFGQKTPGDGLAA